MIYLSNTARNRTHNLFRPKCAPIPLGHSDGLGFDSLGIDSLRIDSFRFDTLGFDSHQFRLPRVWLHRFRLSWVRLPCLGSAFNSDLDDPPDLTAGSQIGFDSLGFDSLGSTPSVLTPSRSTPLVRHLHDFNSSGSTPSVLAPSVLAPSIYLSNTARFELTTFLAPRVQLPLFRFPVAN